MKLCECGCPCAIELEPGAAQVCEGCRTGERCGEMRALQAAAFERDQSPELDDAHRLRRGQAAVEVALEHLAKLGRRAPPEVRAAIVALERGLAQMEAVERGTLEEAERTMQGIARNVENRLPAGWRFLVLACTARAPGFTSYVSNIERSDACALLTEWLAKIRLRRPDA